MLCEEGLSAILEWSRASASTLRVDTDLPTADRGLSVGLPALAYTKAC